MNETKPKEEEEVHYKDDLDYLTKSLFFITQAHDQAVKHLRDMKEQQNLLQGDMNVIHTPQLQQACSQIHNSFVAQQKEARTRIKALLVDMKHVRSIYKKLKMVEC